MNLNKIIEIKDKMYFYYRQCNHCGKRYKYQASGEGCFRKFNDKEYCPQCCKTVKEALKQIPIKYHGEWVKICKNKKILANLSKLKEKDKIKTDGFFPKPVKMVIYDGDEFVFKGKRYLYNDNELFIFGEVDSEGIYTGNFWVEDDIGEDRYISTCNFNKLVKSLENLYV